ncbi:MAG: arginine--tRNA ligase [Ignavibacteriae bacterium]|nr:MAG: arginine--tRNA ligase [Ignavibacteriota bacterium]
MHQFLEPSIRAVVTTMGVDPNTPIPFEVPRQAGHGHVTTTIAMSLAKSTKQAPRGIADQVAEALRSAPHVESVDVAGPGFINVTFKPSAFHAVLLSLHQEGDAVGRSTIGAGRSVNVEYVSANPTGPLHAGHGRNCAVGDTIANMHAWCGFDVTREYYFNNAGNQMNKLGESIAARVLELAGHGDILPFPEDGYHGEYIRDIAQSLLTDPAVADFVVADFVVPDLAVADANVADLKAVCRKAGEEWCFASIKQTLASLNIKHDLYFNEDSLYSDGKVQQTIDDLRSNDLVYEKDGATWLALEKLGNPQDKVIVKSTGEPTYRLPDIAYHREKLLRGYDYVVDIFGADHIATIPDVLAAVKALGFETERVRTVIHQMVTFMENGEVVKFSKRSGKSFTLDELIDEVGADVVRFFFIMRAVGTHLDFDLGLAKEEGDKNPVFYLQYAHARISSILRKAQGTSAAIATDHLEVLTAPSEIALIALLSRFRTVLERACDQLEPQAIAEYLRDLAAAYHQFYHDCRILGSEPQVESARLLLADVTRRAMHNGLMVLGVQAPEQM